MKKRVFKELSTDFPACAGWWKSIEPRIIDLMEPFRSFHYDHPRQEGSASIKSVLPDLTGNGYEGMEIADGGTAALEYLRVTLGQVSRTERERVRKNLKEYCSLDARGMIDILEALKEL